jgi:hypothetical protein
VQVHYDEGVAIYIGPEPCVGVREGGDEASAGEGIGQPLSRESLDPGAEWGAWRGVTVRISMLGATRARCPSAEAKTRRGGDADDGLRPSPLQLGQT